MSKTAVDKSTAPMDVKGKDSGVSGMSPELSDLHCFTDTNGVITSTMNDLPGYRIKQVLGTVYGVTVRSRNFAAGFGMAIKSVVGGELQWFTSMLYSCRNDSIGRAVAEARDRGANAIICMRFDAGDLAGYAQSCCFGTACVVEKIDDKVAMAPQLQHTK